LEVFEKLILTILIPTAICITGLRKAVSAKVFLSSFPHKHQAGLSPVQTPPGTYRTGKPKEEGARDRTRDLCIADTRAHQQTSYLEQLSKIYPENGAGDIAAT